MATSACAAAAVAAHDACWGKSWLSACVGWLYAVSGVTSSGSYHNTARHRASPGCDDSLESIWGVQLVWGSLQRIVTLGSGPQSRETESPRSLFTTINEISKMKSKQYIYGGKAEVHHNTNTCAHQIVVNHPTRGTSACIPCR